MNTSRAHQAGRLGALDGRLDGLTEPFVQIASQSQLSQAGRPGQLQIKVGPLRNSGHAHPNT